MSESEINRPAQQVLNICRMTNPKLFYAIRPLLCDNHAKHTSPRVLSINWFTSKRCNYDCSYCSPHIHDAVSPFVDMEISTRFVDNAHHFADSTQRKIRWVFTGGECFIDPHFEDLVRHVGAKSTTCQINVATNGSLPQSRYLDIAGLFSNITFSLHLERSKKEIEKTMQTIMVIHASGLTQVWVNAMYLPGSQIYFEKIVCDLQQAGVAYGVRKITPPAQNFALPYVHTDKGQKNVRLLELQQQSKLLEDWLSFNNATRGKNIDDYYDHADLELLTTSNQSKMSENIGTWTEHSYQEINSEQLISQDLNKFQGWTCWAGVDSIYINHAGVIFRAMCMNDGAIGNIRDKISFQDQPTICRNTWCLCNMDIAIRKTRPGQEHYVNGD